MVIGSKFQLQSLQLENFSISLDADKLELVEKVEYLGLYVKNDFIHLLRRLRRILPKGLLLKVYISRTYKRNWSMV